VKRQDSSSINAYILDEETRYKVNMSHFTLGERNIRELHDRHHARLQKVKELAESLGVEYTPTEPDSAAILRKKELVKKYHENRELYDNVINNVLEVCTPTEAIEFITKHIQQP